MPLAKLLASIPYVVWHNVRIDEDTGQSVVLRIPFRDDLANYVGSFHAGALYTLAETAAGVIADRALPAGQAFVLLRDAQIRYTRRPEGDVSAHAALNQAGASTTRQEFSDTGRADIAVTVSMTDEAGASVFEGEFTYALRPRKQ